MHKLARILILFLGLSVALSMTVQLKKNEQFCTFKFVEKDSNFNGDYVISGFNEQKVNAMIYSPGNKVVYSSVNKREGKWNFNALENGEYRVCFRTQDAKQKFVSFNLHTEEDNKEEQKGGLTTENIDVIRKDMQGALTKMRRILQNQGFQKAREGIHTKNSAILLSRIHYSAIFKIVVLVAFACGQLFILTSLFKKRKAVPYV